MVRLDLAIDTGITILDVDSGSETAVTEEYRKVDE